jgi:hypothetical protein
MLLQIFTAKPVCSLHINHERWAGTCNSEAEHGVDTDCPADQAHKQPQPLLRAQWTLVLFLRSAPWTDRSQIGARDPIGEREAVRGPTKLCLLKWVFLPRYSFCITPAEISCNHCTSDQYTSELPFYCSVKSMTQWLTYEVTIDWILSEWLTEKLPDSLTWLSINQLEINEINFQYCYFSGLHTSLNSKMQTRF